MPGTILAATGEAAIGRLIQVNLERQGYQVITAHDGKEALEKVVSVGPDLIVLDVMLPPEDGFQVLQSLRRDPATRDIPVVMLTAGAQDADVFRGWRSPPDRYLTKPFHPTELVAIVKGILGSLPDGDGPGTMSMFGNLWEDVAC